MSSLAELAPVTSTPTTLQSDIAEALRLGLALFPSGSARRMVLFSDGVATVGDTTEAAVLAASSGVPVDVVTLTRPEIEDEALLLNVKAPARVSQGEQFTLEISVESNRAMPATLHILAGGAIVDQFVVELRPGVNNFTRLLRAAEQSFARYVVQITPADDTLTQNNQLAAFTEIIGPPRILLVAPDGTLDDRGQPLPDEAPQLLIALRATGLQVDQIAPGELPSSLAQLSNYASVMLLNVNAKSLSPRRMASLQTFVRDLGGGLIVVGGPQSYGMGGYFRTPLEETLPVDMQIKDQERFPSVSMVLVIDRSGSMAAPEGGVTKIQLADEGAVRVVELLNDFDEIAIIPVDTSPDNPIGPVLAADREEIIGQIRGIGAGGGGIYIRTGLEAAADALAQSQNQIQHIIVLADGADSEQKEGVEPLIETLVDSGVTISMVSIGDGPDVPWLQRMAELGGGRFHFTNQAANLPQIFTQETTAIQRSYLVEERFFPVLGTTGFARGHSIFQAMERAGLTRVPPLLGYVGTGPKETARVILETHLGDPLLAAWEYGLGRSVAWTSDATGRWGVEWVEWDGFPAFWSNIVRWSISQGRGSSVETAVELVDGKARVLVDARDGEGAFLNELTLRANVVGPSGEVTELLLPQTAPGRYEAEFSPANDGAYFLRVSGGDESGEFELGQTSGWVLAYSPEYQRLEADPQLMAEIADLTGGRGLSGETLKQDPTPIFQHNIAGARVTRPIWSWLLTLAVLLLPLDIAVRRLALSRRDLDRAWAAATGRVRRPPLAVPQRSEQVSRLFQAKRRASTILPEENNVVVDPHTQVTEQLDEPRIAPRSVSEPGIQTGIEKSPSEPGTGDRSLASRLLDKRRQRQADENNAQSEQE